jgi:ribosomal protein L11 methyltransferase
MADFLELKAQPIDNSEDGLDIVVALLSNYPFDIFETENNIVQAHGGITGFSNDLKLEIESTLEPFCLGIEWIETDKVNWNELWEKNFFDPLNIENVHIRATFHPEKKEGIVITIEPKMSFGTGHHSTTQLMVEEMLHFKTYFEKATVLDMGTGTGILAILAEKLNASETIGIEIDDWVVDNANENIEINHCQNTKIIHGTANELAPFGDEYFDVCLANIHREIILNDFSAYYDVTKNEGLIFLSGLQESDYESVKSHIDNFNIKLMSKKISNGWMSLVYLKGKA